jgi:gluconokinase
MAWFPRMLDKLRLHARGELPPDYVPWLGNGFDGRCCRFLRVEYAALVARTLQGGTDEDILEWCFQVGRPLSDEDIEVWSAFICKRGLRDSPDILADLEDSKRKSGFGHRADIDTYLRRHDAEEGRDRAASHEGSDVRR